jgi:TonB-dependent SusC/RagA subfamily outer membrane receptor
MHLLQYLFKLSISLAILYVFYRTVLRPLTFYQWNRFCLLGYSLLSFTIPFINVSPWMEEGKHNNQLADIIPAIGNYTVITGNSVVTTGVLQNLTIYQWLVILFCLGAAIMVFKFIFRCISLRRIRSKSILLNSSHQVQLYQTRAPVRPFSFGNAIYFNASLHSEEELQRIIRHEFVHVKQKHSIDIMMAELLCIVNWFNPFAWLIRHAIRQNLEFIADNDVITNGIDKKEYQYLLLKVVGIPQYSIANNFNFSNLKKRIAMMNKMKSTRLQLTKFLFVLPLLVLLLLAFRNTTNAGEKKTGIQNHITGISQRNDMLPPENIFKEQGNAVTDTLPASTKEKLDTITIRDGKKEIILHINKNDTTGSNANTAAVTWKDGSKEFYNLNDPTEKAAFYKKYGDRLNIEPPVPPMPPPPVPGAVPPPPAIPHLPDNVKGMSTYKNIDKKTGTNIYTVTITLKNGKKEKYNLNDPKEKAAYTDKYGELPEKVSPLSPVEPVPPITEAFDVDKSDAHASGTGHPPSRKDAPLYIVNDVVQANGFDLNTINANDIESINVLKDQKAIDKYGDKAKNGAIEITRKPPLFIIDSIIQPHAFDLKTVDPVKIQSINVLKGKNATDMYGERADHGAVIITMKKNGDDMIPPGTLIILDGRELPAGTKIADWVKPDDIESVTVLKDTRATIKYGSKGKNGVIEIKTKIRSSINKPDSITKIDRVVHNHFDQLIVDGSMTTNNNESIIEGSFSFENKNDMPLIIFDGTEMAGVTSFKAAKARYNFHSLNPKEGMAKYGSKAKYGVLEITKLDKVEKANVLSR